MDELLSGVMKLRPLAYVALGGLLGIIGVAIWNVRHYPFQPAPVAAPGESSPPPSEILDSGADLFAATSAPATSDESPTAASALSKPQQKAALADLDNVQFMLRDFRARMHGNPEGTNAEIMKSVMGGNPVQAHLGPPEGQRLNEQGELVDRWGTPYFFHQLSKEEMEVRSSGPDRTMWTTDDLVMK